MRVFVWVGMKPCNRETCQSTQRRYSMCSTRAETGLVHRN